MVAEPPAPRSPRCSRTSGTTRLRTQLLLDLFQLAHLLLSPQVSQFVVVGAQSAGKSSVLSRLSSVTFPQSSERCTRIGVLLKLRSGPATPVRVELVGKVKGEPVRREFHDGKHSTAEAIRLAQDKAVKLAHAGDSFVETNPRSTYSSRRRRRSTACSSTCPACSHLRPAATARRPCSASSTSASTCRAACLSGLGSLNSLILLISFSQSGALPLTTFTLMLGALRRPPPGRRVAAHLEVVEQERPSARPPPGEGRAVRSPRPAIRPKM
jgi:hypothetical protein